MSVKRYEWVACDEHACHCDVVESAEGDMVDYEDYAALEARCAALASLEAEPVSVIKIDHESSLIKHVKKVVSETNAPPAPLAVPDGLRLALSNAGIAAPESDEMLAATCEKYIQALVTWVKARKPFRSAVIPDGWVMVPVEPTDDMIVNGFESEPDESFIDEKEWEAYDAMSGCQQAAHRAKLCWAAMIKAAPKLE
ncbi:hypothetical protein OEC43_002690 [Salmonella enterica subsp. enterica serovar Johannesburg]|nr:hypothetical protein [Salmonella enterica]EBA9638309.1 hypothetical protein [Salmonella enterica subsp. enterica serovar Johannesburg]EBD8054659.1 hypothetical protein [Salmonella enterica subsp. enterica serovar Johannesburg]EBH5305736.1 hypothetical protein [Salmonella enterica subsp. enterica serovar Johannesburg]ECC5540057.1 hypothetical protein [Salmonella enterica]